MTDDQKQKIIALRRDGAGYGQIAATIGISINTVKSFCRRHSLAAKKGDSSRYRINKKFCTIFCMPSDKYPFRGYRVEETNKTDLGKECELG